MSKRYDDPVDVEGSNGALYAFTWRGKRYDVDQHLGSWREAVSGWDPKKVFDREYHRLLAHPAGVMATGELDGDGFVVRSGAVYDIFVDRTRGVWKLARIWD